ncbi:hypothetical protein Trydic_g9697 [Trypoxylus dichotomus]
MRVKCLAFVFLLFLCYNGLSDVNGAPSKSGADNETVVDTSMLLEDRFLVNAPPNLNWVYTPTDNVTADIKDNFFDDLTGIPENVGNRKDVVLVGGFNGRIGKKVGDKIVEQHDEYVINDNGMRLIEVCHQ